MKQPPTFFSASQSLDGSIGFRKSTLRLLLGIFVVRGIILACVLPPFEGWDEYQHVGYIDHCAHYSSPAVYLETRLDADFARAVEAFPLPKDALTQITGASTYGQYWNHTKKTTSSTASIGFYQSQHPFLYYRLMSPIYQLCGGRVNLRLAVSVLRLVNLIFGTFAMWMILRWVRLSVPVRYALGAACCVIFQPLLLLNVIRVSNDAMAFMLGTLVVILCLSDRNRPWQSPLMAIILPLAVLAKATNLSLLPLVTVVYGLRFVNRRSLGNLAGAILILGSFILSTWSYFAFNLHHFGVITPMQEAVVNHRAGRTFMTIITGPPLNLWFIWTWCLWIHNALWVGGWSFLSLPKTIVVTYDILMGFGLLSLSIRLLSNRLSLEKRGMGMILLLIVSAQLGLMYHAVQAYSAWHGQVSTNPWYAAVAIPWWLILVSCALTSLSRGRGGLVLALSIPILDFATEIYGTMRQMMPCYYGSGSTAQTMQRLSSLHPAWLGTYTVTIFAVILGGLLVVLAGAAIGFACSDLPEDPGYRSAR